VDNKIAAGEVGQDLRRVADTLVETVTETERAVDKNVSPMPCIMSHAICNDEYRDVVLVSTTYSLLKALVCHLVCTSLTAPH